MHRLHLSLLLLGLALLGLPGCDELVSDPDAERRAAAQATLAEASESIQLRVTQTCERWKDSQGTCDEEKVAVDILDCWSEKGLPHLRAALKNGVRKRARERRVIMHHSLCMEKRGWRLVPGSGGYF